MPVASLSGQPPSLVGRERELGVLRDHLAATLGGRGSLVLIGGEAGIGKTTLAEAILGEAGQQGFVVLKGHCFDLAETPPYGPFIDLFLHLPGARDMPPLPEAFARRGTVGAVASQMALFAQVEDFLAALATAHRVAVLLDDLHWADPASLDLLRFLARSLSAFPLLILATYRSDELTRRHPLAALLPALAREANALRIALRRLDTDAVGAIVAARYPLEESDATRLVAYLHERTEGNPFFLGELLRMLEEEGALQPTNDGWSLSDLEQARVPTLLRQVIEGRLARFDEQTQQALAVAAVIGQEVPVNLWASIVGGDEESLLAIVEQVCEARLVEMTASGSGFRFVHALIREALYEGILPLRRRLWHRRIGELLAAPLHPDPDAVAAHFERAGDRRAVEWLVRAGEYAQALHAPHAAIERFTRALAVATSLEIESPIELYRARGHAFETVGDFERARTDYERAMRAAHGAGVGVAEWESMLDLSLLWAGRDYAQVERWLRRATELSRTLADARLRARSLNRLGNWLVNVGRTLEGIAAHREALEILEAVPDERGVAETLDSLGMANWFHGDAAGSVRAFTRAIDDFRAMGDTHGLISGLTSRGNISSPATVEPVISAGLSHTECVRDVTEALHLARQAEWPAGQAYAEFCTCAIHSSFGDWGVACTHGYEALRIAEGIEHRQWIAAARCMLGQTYVSMLATDRAIEHLTIALRIAQSVGSAWWSAYAGVYLSLAYLLRRDGSRAEQTLTILQPRDHLPRNLGERRLAWAWGEWMCAAGDTAGAIRIVDHLLASPPGGDTTQPIAALLRLKGLALLASGRIDMAVPVLEDAKRGALLRGERPLLWGVHGALARAYRLTKDEGDVRRELAAAHTEIDALALTIDDTASREDFSRVARASMLTTAAIPQYPDGLSAREAEVLRHIAAGMSNREIAAALSVSVRTVERHIENLYRKIDARSKADATAYAFRHRLI